MKKNIKKKRADKRGFELLGTHTIEIVIAVLCILVLIYAAFKFAGLLQGSSDLEKAKQNILVIDATLKSLKGKTESSAILFGPTDWWVIAWPYQKEFPKPPQCKNGYCICICKVSGFGRTDSLNACISDGVCVDSDKPIATFDSSGTNVPLTIVNPPFVLNFTAVINVRGLDYPGYEVTISGKS